MPIANRYILHCYTCYLSIIPSFLASHRHNGPLSTIPSYSHYSPPPPPHGSIYCHSSILVLYNDRDRGLSQNLAQHSGTQKGWGGFHLLNNFSNVTSKQSLSTLTLNSSTFFSKLLLYKGKHKKCVNGIFCLDDSVITSMRLLAPTTPLL